MAGQDIVKRLQPGQSQPVQVGGDFIFLKFADRPIVFIINGGEGGGSRVTMEAGDKYRPGGFESFEIENTDKERPAQLVMTVGRGDYNRQIVKGEIVVAPGIRSADGTLKEDRRQEISAVMVPDYPAISEKYLGGDILSKYEQQPLVIDGVDRPINLMLGRWAEGNELFQLYEAGSGSQRFIIEERFNERLERTGQQVIAKTRATAFLHSALKAGEEYLFFYGDTARVKVKKIDETAAATSFAEMVTVAELDTEGYAFGATAHPLGVCLTLSPKMYEDNPEVLRVIDPVTYQTRLKWHKSDMVGSGQWDRTPTVASYDTLSDRWSLGTDASNYHLVYNADFTEVIHERTAFYQDQLDGTSSGNQTGAVILIGQFLYGNFRSGINEEKASVKKYAVEDAGAFMSGSAYSVGCYRPGIRRDTAENLSLAAVTVREQYGVTEISGQLIKAMIELYYGRILRKDFNYLDHVYQLTVNGQNGETLQVQTQANGSTFAGLGIKDQFKAKFPATVKLTVDDQLETITKLGA